MTAIISNLELADLNLTNIIVDNPIGGDNPPLLIPNTNANHPISHSRDVEIPTQQVLEYSDFCVAWEDNLNDVQLDKLVNDGWIVIDNVFNNKALLALQAESGFINYRDAQLTAGIQVRTIRGDKIRWINKEFFAGFYYLQSINELGALFNRTLFAGIRHSEAHYACYPIGFGYQWHNDNPVNRHERIISAVFYMNDDWETGDGGALEVIDKYGIYHEIMPIANRLVLFDSNLTHQVQIAHRQRYSIATWMRSDDLVPFIENDS